jgi:adenosylhomocysteine nucleosidase
MLMTIICIITALPAEARPFIDSFKLRHLEARGLRLYGNDRFLLLQTGVGKLKAAAATAALLQSRPEIGAIINTGIAGGTGAKGTAVLGHHIVDTASGAQWFPHLPPRRITAPLTSAAVHTVDVPCTDYREDVIFDMEAAAVFSAASAYLSTDAMHCIKVISDNEAHSVNSINTDHVVELMQNATPAISSLFDWQMNNTIIDPSIMMVTSLCRTIESRVHHTVSEKHQLHRLLQQYSSMAGALPELCAFDEFSSAKQIKRYLQYSLSNVPFIYGT